MRANWNHVLRLWRGVSVLCEFQDFLWGIISSHSHPLLLLLKFGSRVHTQQPFFKIVRILSVSACLLFSSLIFHNFEASSFQTHFPWLFMVEAFHRVLWLIAHSRFLSFYAHIFLESFFRKVCQDCQEITSPQIVFDFGE